MDNLEISQRDRGVLPVLGTTYLTPAFSLGSANRSDFWVQRRPLIAYWGAPQHPPQCMQLRVVKDDYDFSSGLFYSVQEAGCVLGAIAFRSDGGDKHPSLDPIRNGTFHLTRLYAQFSFRPWRDSWRIWVDGKPSPQGEVRLPLSSRISIDTNGCLFCLEFRAASFGKSIPALRLACTGEEARIDLMFFEASSEQTLHWAEVTEAGCSFTLALSNGRTSLADFDRRCASGSFTQEQHGNSIRYRWGSPAAPLEITVLRGAQPVARMDAAYDERLDGNVVPMMRLSEEKIVS